ncbi:MAG: ROK family protein [Coriobacteriales bacterium]|nr:ROK family protein [Coriobacteriales bacterium]MDO5709904.1 ROK family protein [Coriobacteriales bacterium]
MAKQYLVLDIGGTFIKYALMDEDATFIEQGKVLADTTCEEAMLASLGVLAAKFSETDYEGVAISMPGRIGTKEGIAYTGGAFQWIRDYPAGERYGAVFGKPCTIANDGKCAAYAESWKGALSDVDSGAVIVLGTGIGGGIVINNEVWMGATGGAGELSAFPCNFDTFREPITFTHGITGIWAGRCSAGSIVGKYGYQKQLGQVDGIRLFDDYEAGDPVAKAVIDEFAFQMSIGIYGIQSVLDLPRYAIGGGISARPETTTVVRDAVDKLFDEQMLCPFGKPEIVTCSFGNEANLIGALAFHLKNQE